MAAILVSSKYLPGVNFETPVLINDLGYQFDSVFASEIRNRLQIVMGNYLADGPKYGIVDYQNPLTALTGGTRSFSVSVNGTVATNIDVQPGVAVTKAGNIIIVDTATVGLTLASTTFNVANIVYLEYSTEDDTSTNTLTRYNTVEARRRIISPTSSVLKTALLSDYNNPLIFTPTRLNDIVVLAVVTNSNTGSGLVIDMSNNTVTANRPWFSPVDIEHRSLKGTGSSTVPHSLGLNDLSQGNLTLYQQMLRHGIVISKDYDVPGCPGHLNLEVITNPSRIFTDLTGLHTGKINQRYANLIGYPLRILAARSKDAYVGEPNDIAVSIIPNTRILLIPDTEVIPTNGFDLYYTSSSAVEPPTEVLVTDQMQFGAPDTTTDLFITGGKAYNTLESNVLDLGNAGPFPNEYNIYLDSTKQFIMSPQVVGCVKYIDPSQPNGIGNTANTPEYSMFGPAHLICGINDLSAVPPPIDVANFYVEFTLIGTNVNDAAITEVVSFNGTEYQPIAVPDTSCGFGATINDPVSYIVRPSKMFKQTTNVFKTLTSWSISNYNVSYMSPQTVAMVWANLETPVTTNLNDLLPLANIRWTGDNVCRIRDIRPVSSTIKQMEQVDRTLSDLHASASAVAITTSILSNSTKSIVLAAEDFNNPYWMDNLRSQRSRFSDGLRSYFWPGPADSGVSAPELYAEYYYTRAIYLPITSNQSKVFIQLLADKYYDSADNAKNIVQYRLSSAPPAWGPWSSASTLGSNLTRSIPLNSGGPYVKLQLRFTLHDVRGFIAVMTGI